MIRRNVSQKFKVFYCRTCNRRVAAPDGRIPDGWLSLVRMEDAQPDGYHRIGLFCSVLCLRRRLSTIEHREQEGAAS